MSKYECRICGKKFDAIPSDALKVGRGSVSPLYRLANGEVHAIGSTKLGKRKDPAKAVKEKEEV